MVTDRPDATESSVIVPVGYVQIETGIGFTEDDGGGEETRSIEAPGTLIRIGLTERLELRLGFTGWVREFEGEGESGVGDSEVGFKYYLIEESGWRPEVAFMAHLSLPTGDTGFSSERFDPSFRFSFSHTLSDNVALGYNLGVAWETEEEESRSSLARRLFSTVASDLATGAVIGLGGGNAFVESLIGAALGESGAFALPDFRDSDTDTLAMFQYTATVGFGLSDKVGMFLEFLGDIPTDAAGDSAHSFDAGFTYLLRDNVQFDAFAGVGLNDDAEDFFAGAGVTFRFPH